MNTTKLVFCAIKFVLIRYYLLVRGECWGKLYEEIGKNHNASHIGGDIFSHSSLCALWDVLHLQPIGMAGIKALEYYVEKQIDASINRGDTTMVVRNANIN